MEYIREMLLRQRTALGPGSYTHLPGPLVRVGVQRRHPLRRQGGDHCIPDLTQLPHSAASRSCSSAAQ